MSLDFVVWLSCSVSLPAALPQSEEWTHSAISAEELASMPKELAAMVAGAESWHLDLPNSILRAAYASREARGWEELAKAAPGIASMVIKAPRSDVDEDQREREARAMRASQERARAASMGVSLVLEGVSEPGISLQKNVASHLAKACGGALVETPAGFVELDKEGRPRM